MQVRRYLRNYLPTYNLLGLLPPGCVNTLELYAVSEGEHGQVGTIGRYLPTYAHVNLLYGTYYLWYFEGDSE